MWAELFRRIYGGLDGWAFIGYKSNGDFSHKAFRFPGQEDEIEKELRELNKWADVYFCPHLFITGDSRTKDNAHQVACLWIDKDKGDINEIRPKPTICWRTSRGRHQAIWLLKTPAPPKEVEQANKLLTYMGKGDKGGWHLGKVIRLPASLNYKYNPPEQGVVLWDDGPTYDLEELRPDKLPPEENTIKEEKELEELPSTPQDIPSVSSVLQKWGRYIPRSAWDLLNTFPQQDEDWSHNLWKLERLLLESGLSAEETFAVVRESPWNKYERDGRPEDQLWVEIVKAVKEKELTAQQQPKGLPWVGIRQLMHHVEKPHWLVQGVWMDKNVGWIAGVGKSYKSTITLDLALSIASGTKFLGKYEVHNPGPVLLVQEEDPMWRVAHRVQSMALAKEITELNMIADENVFSLQVPTSKQVPLLTSVGGGFMFEDKDKVMAVEEAIDAYRPRMVILDPFFMMTPGMDEYKSGEITRALNIMKQWRNAYGCSVAVVHHYRKGEGDGATRLYGSMALYAWSENTLFVERTHNQSKITRDIKDANTHGNDILVTFDDIDEEYTIMVEEGDVKPMPNILRSPEYTARDKIVAYLSSREASQYTTREELSEIVGTSTRTVSKIITELEKSNMVDSIREGKGGTSKYFARPELLREAKERGIDLSNVVIDL